MRLAFIKLFLQNPTGSLEMLQRRKEANGGFPGPLPLPQQDNSILSVLLEFCISCYKDAMPRVANQWTGFNLLTFYDTILLC